MTVLPPDDDPPVHSITSPADGDVYAVGQSVPVHFSCDDGTGWGVVTCLFATYLDSSFSGLHLPKDGELLDTSTPCIHYFGVIAQDKAGNQSDQTNLFAHSYLVVTPVDQASGQVATGDSVSSHPVGGQSRRIPWARRS